MHTMLNPDLATELRYALEVMEENSHLGFDDEYASKLREIPLRRIDKTETALSVRPTHPVLFIVPTKTSA